MGADSGFKWFLGEVQKINYKIDGAGKIYTEFIDSYPTERRRIIYDKESARKDGYKNVSERFKGLISEIQKEIGDLSVKIKKEETPQMRHHIKGLIERTKRIVGAYAISEQQILKKEKENQRNQYLIANPSATSEELDQLDDEDLAHAVIEAAYSLGNKEATEKLEEAKKRSKNIFEIVKDIEVLNEIGNSLQNLILEANREISGTRVASYVAQENTEKVNLEMEKTRIRRQKNRTFKLLGLLIALIIVILLAGYILKALKPILPSKPTPSAMK